MLRLERVHRVEEAKRRDRGSDESCEFSQEFVLERVFEVVAEWHELRIEHLQKGVKRLRPMILGQTDHLAEADRPVAETFDGGADGGSPQDGSLGERVDKYIDRLEMLLHDLDLDRLLVSLLRLDGLETLHPTEIDGRSDADIERTLLFGAFARFAGQDPLDDLPTPPTLVHAARDGLHLLLCELEVLPVAMVFRRLVDDGAEEERVLEQTLDGLDEQRGEVPRVGEGRG